MFMNAYFLAIYCRQILIKLAVCSWKTKARAKPRAWLKSHDSWEQTSKSKADQTRVQYHASLKNAP